MHALLTRYPAFADFNPEHSASGPTPERLAHLKEHGFVIINDFVDSPWIAKLREAGRRVTEACAPDNSSHELTGKFVLYIEFRPMENPRLSSL